jgi:Recombinase
MSRRRLRRRSVKAQRHARPLESRDEWELLPEISRPHAPGTVRDAERATSPHPGAERRTAVRQAATVERLAYTRAQAAKALGVSRSTFIRRVLPLVATIDMPWGTKLIPVDELERLLGELRRQASAELQPVARPGRKATVRADIVARIRDERLSGRTYGDIARGLNADGVETAQGGREWWPSTVRAIFVRSRPPASAPDTEPERGQRDYSASASGTTLPAVAPAK